MGFVTLSLSQLPASDEVLLRKKGQGIRQVYHGAWFVQDQNGHIASAATLVLEKTMNGI